jgi:hypothetical protein
MKLLRKMRHRHELLMFALLTIITACSTIGSTIEVGSDYDPKANFATYRTYSWLPRVEEPGADRRLQSTLLHSRIRDAVEAQLSSKGLTKDLVGKPDILVTYHLALKGKFDVTTVPNYPYFPSSWGATTTTNVRQYEEGSLILDLIDASNQQLVWRGSAQAEVKPDASPQEKEKRINEAVQRILERYPPR